VYEVRLANTSQLTVRLDRVTARNGSTSATLKRASGRAIRTIMSTPVAPATRTLGPAQSGTLWTDVSLRRGARVPKRLVHRFVTTVRGRDFPKRVSTWRGARTRVDRRRPIVISPPLKGTAYYDGNGCCGASPHTPPVGSGPPGRPWTATTSCR
jgi:hypothetical protein